jgi:hypothetical protein
LHAVVDGLALVIIWGSLAVAALCAVSAAINRPTGDPHLYTGVAVEAVLLAQVVVAIVQMIGGDRATDMAVFISYLLLIPFVLPVGFFLSLVERTRWGSVIFGCACLLLPVLVVRLQDLWGTGA